MLLSKINQLNNAFMINDVIFCIFFFIFRPNELAMLRVIVDRILGMKLVSLWTVLCSQKNVE